MAQATPTDKECGRGTFHLVTFTEHRSRATSAPIDVAWSVLADVGADGWGRYDAAWRLRGRVDLWLGGPGMRGRPARRLTVGDPVDLWRVDEIVPGTEIVLRTEARMPGTAWMRLRVMPVGPERSLLTQDLVFEPGGPFGLPGKALWFAELPAHKLVFSGMLRDLAREAERRHAAGPRARRSWGSA